MDDKNGVGGGAIFSMPNRPLVSILHWITVWNKLADEVSGPKALYRNKLH